MIGFTGISPAVWSFQLWQVRWRPLVALVLLLLLLLPGQMGIARWVDADNEASPVAQWGTEENELWIQMGDLGGFVTLLATRPPLKRTLGVWEKGFSCNMLSLLTPIMLFLSFEVLRFSKSPKLSVNLRKVPSCLHRISSSQNVVLVGTNETLIYVVRRHCTSCDEWYDARCAPMTWWFCSLSI